MQNTCEDPVESRVAQLEYAPFYFSLYSRLSTSYRAIAARRNKLLGQMFQLIRQRHGLDTALDDSNDEEEELKLFLARFDLNQT